MTTQMTVLVVDDSPIDRRLAGRIIDKTPGLTAAYASDGLEALEMIADAQPHIVLTDLLMPGMDGLELVAKARVRHPELPVVLMTAHGSEETAVRALTSGAASYVPKRLLAKQLVETLEAVLEVTGGARDERRVYGQLMTEGLMRYELGHDPTAITAMVRHLEAMLGRMTICDHADRVQVGVALREALINAVDHGNLELDSGLKDDGPAAYHELGAERRKTLPYCDRRVAIVTQLRPGSMTFTVTDEGPGFDLASVHDPTDLLHLEREYGRGLLLIRTFMDDVFHNDRGNEITMTKRQKPDRTPEAT